MMWKRIGLIGRDALLARELLPRLRRKTAFLLSGPRGVGNTALLEWCRDNYEGRSALVSSDMTVKEMLKEICGSLGLVVEDNEGNEAQKNKWQVAWMERAIARQSGHVVFLDDVDSLKPAQARRVAIIRDRYTLICTCHKSPRNHAVRSILQGIPKVRVKPLKRDHAIRLAGLAAAELESLVDARKAAQSSRGLPGPMLRYLTGEAPETCAHGSDEIDISPLILFSLAGIAALRYAGKAMDSSIMPLLGGLGMAFGLIVRFWLFRGMRR